MRIHCNCCVMSDDKIRIVLESERDIHHIISISKRERGGGEHRTYKYIDYVIDLSMNMGSDADE